MNSKNDLITKEMEAESERRAKDGEGHCNLVLQLIAEHRAAERRVLLAQWAGCVIWLVVTCASLWLIYETLK